MVANELFDDATYTRWVSRVEQHAREVGALIALQVTLLARAKQEVRAGQFAAAEMTFGRVVEITRLIGGHLSSTSCSRSCVCMAESRITRHMRGKTAERIGRRDSHCRGHTMAWILRSQRSNSLSAGTHRRSPRSNRSSTNPQAGYTCLRSRSRRGRARTANQPARARYLDDLQQRAQHRGLTGSRATRPLRALLATTPTPEDLYLEAIATTRVDDDRHRTGTSPARLPASGSGAKSDRSDAAGAARTAYDASRRWAREGFAARARSELRRRPGRRSVVACRARHRPHPARGASRSTRAAGQPTQRLRRDVHQHNTSTTTCARCIEN